MHREDLFVNDCRNGQTVEAIRKGLPQLDVVAALALIVETIDTVNASTLMIATQNEKVLGILDLVRQQQANSLETLLPSVDVVAQEEVVTFRREATIFEQSEQVVILSVNITCCKT